VERAAGWIDRWHPRVCRRPEATACLSSHFWSSPVASALTCGEASAS
jgi:hypothetical protein